MPFWCLGLCFERTTTTTFLQAAARWLESTWMGQTNAEVALLKRHSASNCTWGFKLSHYNAGNSRAPYFDSGVRLSCFKTREDLDSISVIHVAASCVPMDVDEFSRALSRFPVVRARDHVLPPEVRKHAKPVFSSNVAHSRHHTFSTCRQHRKEFWTCFPAELIRRKFQYLCQLPLSIFLH